MSKTEIVFVEPDEMDSVTPQLDRAIAGLTKYYGEVAAQGGISFAVVDTKGGKGFALIAKDDAVADPQLEWRTCRNILKSYGIQL